jgi:hypothetical protein
VSHPRREPRHAFSDRRWNPAGATPWLTSFTALMVLATEVGCDGDASPRPEAAHTTLLTTGTIELLGDGLSACSHQPAVAGAPAPERWCAFSRGHAHGQPADLWVVNLDRARAGLAACDGSSPYCVQLTSTLWTGDPVFSPAHPYVHGFFGDTLLYYADSTSGNGDDAFEGTIWAWRPGMAQGRVVSGARGYYCFGDTRSASVACLSNQGNVPTTGAASSALEFDLLGGPVEGGPVGPLPLIERIRPYDPDGSLVWGTAFSPNGEWFTLATKVADVDDTGKARPVQALRIVPAKELGQTAPREILRDVDHWIPTPDSSKILFVRDTIKDEFGGATATLMAADFPSGANPTKLATGISRYEVYGDPGEPTKAVGLYQNIGDDISSFRIMNDLGHPDSVITIASHVEDALVSPDLRFSFFQDVNEKGDTISVMARNDGSGKCLLNQNAGQGAYSVKFLPRFNRVIWAEDATGSAASGANIEGWMGNPDGCGGAQRFSARLGYYQPTAEGLIYGETDAASISMVLRYARFTGRGIGKPVELTSRSGLNNAVVDARYIVFTVSEGPNTTAGLYVHGPLL